MPGKVELLPKTVEDQVRHSRRYNVKVDAGPPVLFEVHQRLLEEPDLEPVLVWRARELLKHWPAADEVVHCLSRFSFSEFRALVAEEAA